MFISLIAMTGCGDDDPTNTGDNNDDNNDQVYGNITCTVDGTNWNFDTNGAGVETTPGWLLLACGTADGANGVLITIPDAEGTFSGTAVNSINMTDTVTISNGTFNVSVARIP